MKICILYSTALTPSPGSVAVPVGDTGFIYVRAEAVSGRHDLDSALRAASPMDGETILNSAEYIPTKKL